MSKQMTDSQKSSTVRAPLSEHVFNAQALTPLYEVNKRCLELLKSSNRGHGESAKVELANQLRDLLDSATPETINRAATRPLLLVDFQFRQDAWWRGASADSRKALRLRSWLMGFPRKSGIALARATLTLAWTLVRTDTDAACVILGMSRSVAEVMITLALADIDRIAERQFRHVRPRWESKPLIWRKLLIAAQANDAHELRQFDLHALQLLAGELAPAENQA